MVFLVADPPCDVAGLHIVRSVPSIASTTVDQPSGVSRGISKRTGGLALSLILVKPGFRSCGHGINLRPEIQPVQGGLVPETIAP